VKIPNCGLSNLAVFLAAVVAAQQPISRIAKAFPSLE